MNEAQSFHQEIAGELDSFLRAQENRFPQEETLVMDLHCHDHNSNVPDELLGRILGIPETWLSSEELLSVLMAHGCNAYTVTNHNNARSCYELRDQGHDVLVGAEFSCMVPDYRTGIHVLAYGFTPDQEKKLLKLRSDIYRFQEYTAEHDIPTIWAHPLFHYKSSGIPPMEFFEKMSLLFERFETINGQRDSWQNMLVRSWVETMTPDYLDRMAARFGIPANRFCRSPHRKSMAGGSDSHMGIFTGLTGVRLHVPGLENRLDESRSDLALEAIRAGAMAPFGSHNDSEKMAISFMDYFCQIGLNMKDPGLVRMLLHKGDAREKLLAFAIANGFFELRRHKTTLNFIKIFHDCFSGRVPKRGTRFVVPRAYKKVFGEAMNMAVIRRDDPEQALQGFERSVTAIYEDLASILFSRLAKKIEHLDAKHSFSSMNLDEVVGHFEFPSHARDLFEPRRRHGGGAMTDIDLASFFDGLSFPFLGSSVILAAFYAGARVMYHARPLLRQFAAAQGLRQHPSRTLWLTDTFEDANGVAMVLKSMLAEVQRRNLPIDFMVASNTLQSEDHLIVVPPLAEYRLPFYEQQPLRVPNILQMHRLFKNGEYDRIICSTEGPMGLAALYLKSAYSVPAHFYVHTDWMMFADRVLRFDEQNKNRLRRILRAFYRSFDSLFVLNTDQQKWLTGSTMGFDPSRVHLTAHWADEGFVPRAVARHAVFRVADDVPVVLFAGRVSDEKGVMELPAVMAAVREKVPGARLAVAGMGPRENDLRAAMPDAIFLGWVDHDRLPEVYSAADLLVLPSKFDTFGCVVLEALSCGLPVVAYRTKGPKDIILDGENGYLVKTRSEMAGRIAALLADREMGQRFRRSALARARDYDPDRIIAHFLDSLMRAA